MGRLTNASDTASGAGTIDFAYDALDRLIQETTGQGSVSYQYDVLGRRTNMAANGQQPVTYGYDAASRLTQVAQGSLTVGLGYDNANRRTSLTYPNGTSTSYVYDVASRLTNINHQGPSGIIEALTYQYDPAGNRTSLTRNNAAASLLPAAVASATYDAANEQTAFAGQVLEYDANGNLLKEKDGTGTVLREYAWDTRNRLVGITGNATAEFKYDPLGRRTSKTVNTVASQYLYDGNDVVAEIGGGAIGANYLRSLNIDEPFIRQVSTGNEYYHVDALGSTLALSNALGSSGITYTYEPFGKATATGGSSNSSQYTGRENDGTGIYYYRARYYSPTVHRFISQDPLDLDGGDLNFYIYTANDPVNYTDPSGEVLVAGCLVGAGVSVGADILAGRKISISSAGIACAEGAVLGGGLRALRFLNSAKGGIGPVLKGRAGVERAEAAARARGEIVIGREVTFETSAGRTRVDLVSKTPEGNLRLIEAKNGPSARVTANQRANFEALSKEGGNTERGKC